MKTPPSGTAENFDCIPCRLKKSSGKLLPSIVYARYDESFLHCKLCVGVGSAGSAGRVGSSGIAGSAGSAGSAGIAESAGRVVSTGLLAGKTVFSVLGAIIYSHGNVFSP